MYYPDLSIYEYLKEAVEPNALNVGWLDDLHPYATGVTTEKFHKNLFSLCQKKVNVTRGVHPCPFCGFFGVVTQGANQVVLGGAEIRVVHGNKIYHAPTLIYHYVIVHQYLPPEEFVKAVMENHV